MSAPVCRLCLRPLVYVHGHGQCDAPGCPLRGQNQDECCRGETAQPATPAGTRARPPGTPSPSDR